MRPRGKQKKRAKTRKQRTRYVRVATAAQQQCTVNCSAATALPRPLAAAQLKAARLKAAQLKAAQLAAVSA